MQDLNCPISSLESSSLTDWLLGYAVRLEYGDNVEKYKAMTAESVKQNQPSPDAAKTSNPIDSMDFEGADFKAGVASLAQLLQIPPHPDHKQVLQAVCIVIKERLSKEALSKSQNQEVSKVFLPLDKMDLGFETGDYISTEAAKILRLLHIRDLRDLQTDINSAIVKVQAITANPKTDTRLGQVGRM